jgi:hypothetical protein
MLSMCVECGSEINWCKDQHFLTNFLADISSYPLTCTSRPWPLFCGWSGKWNRACFEKTTLFDGRSWKLCIGHVILFLVPVVWGSLQPWVMYYIYVAVNRLSLPSFFRILKNASTRVFLFFLHCFCCWAWMMFSGDCSVIAMIMLGSREKKAPTTTTIGKSYLPTYVWVYTSEVSSHGSPASWWDNSPVICTHWDDSLVAFRSSNP